MPEKRFSLPFWWQNCCIYHRNCRFKSVACSQGCFVFPGSFSCSLQKKRLANFYRHGYRSQLLFPFILISKFTCMTMRRVVALLQSLESSRQSMMYSLCSIFPLTMLSTCLALFWRVEFLLPGAAEMRPTITTLMKGGNLFYDFYMTIIQQKDHLYIICKIVAKSF